MRACLGLSCVGDVKCRVGDNDLQQTWIPTRQGDELAEWVVVRMTIQSKVPADIRRD